MKKLFLLFTCSIILLGTAGCTKESSEDKMQKSGDEFRKQTIGYSLDCDEGSVVEDDYTFVCRTDYQKDKVKISIGFDDDFKIDVVTVSNMKLTAENLQESIDLMEYYYFVSLDTLGLSDKFKSNIIGIMNTAEEPFVKDLEDEGYRATVIYNSPTYKSQDEGYVISFNKPLFESKKAFNTDNQPLIFEGSYTLSISKK